MTKSGKKWKKQNLPRINSDIKKILDSNGNPLTEENQQQIQLLLDTLKTSFGIDIYFQKDKNGQVRGYGLVDHSKKITFDGRKVMKLSELIDFTPKPERKPTPIDVYRNLFTAEIVNDGKKDHIVIHMKDGKTYQKEISSKQYLWYSNAKPEEKEDITLMIAASMFRKELLVSYLKQDRDSGLKQG